MVKKEYTQVIIRKDLSERVRKKIERDYKDKMNKPELSTYVQEVLWDILEEDEVLKRYGPMLEEFSVDQEKILIKDNRPEVNRIAELTYQDHMLYCNLDNSDSCLHVGFAWSIPMVYRMLMARGQKKPRVSRQEDEE